MPELDNGAIAELLDTMGDLLEVSGADRFRVLSYHKAARAIREWPAALSAMAAEGCLEEIPGVGKRLAAAIAEILATGTFVEYEQLKTTFTPTLVQLMDVPGLGPKRARALHDALGVETIDDLKRVIADGTIATAPGFKDKTVAAIAENIEHAERHSERMLLMDALPLAERIVAQLVALPGVDGAAAAGSIRRREPTVGDIDVVASADDPAAVHAAVRDLPLVARVIATGEDRTSVLTTSGRRADIHVVPRHRYGATLQQLTGSEAHNVRLRQIARSRRLVIDEHGVSPAKGGKRLAGETEESVYAALGMDMPPPEIRSGSAEVDAALAHELPELLEMADIRGDMHAHTTSTDAKSTLEENRAMAAELGYEYVAVTDHAYDLRMVRGLDVERLREQWAHADRLNAEGARPVILKGIELNIGPEGGVDYPEGVLAAFDFCIASIHGGMRAPSEEVTARMVAAMRNPYVDIIGHCTGRILGRRGPMALDMEEVLRCAGETGTIMEINAYPDRLDLSDEHIALARRFGVRFALGTDAHRSEQMRFMPYGVATARRGWVVPAEVLNAQPLDTLKSWLKRNRG